MKLPASKLPNSYDKNVFSNLLLTQDEGATDASGIIFLVDSQASHCRFIGIMEITVALLETKECDLNSEDSMRTAGIAWAAKKG